MRYLLFFFMVVAGLNTQAKKLNILLVTGGHNFDTVQFYNMFDSFSDIKYKPVWQPEANKMIASGEAAKYDLLVFYDMVAKITDDEKAGYISLTKAGKPLLFMHHSLCSYQNWPEFESMLGGKYVLKGDNVPANQLSTYKHDVWVNMEAIDPGHPVTKGLAHFRLFDEVYGNYRVGKASKPLLRTDHPESTPVVAWETRYNSSTVVYLQPGHDKKSYENSDFRKLVSQAIHYLTEKNNSK